MNRVLVILAGLLALGVFARAVAGVWNPLDIALGCIFGLVVDELLRGREADGREDGN